MRTSKLPGKPTIIRELLFEDGEYSARIFSTEEYQNKLHDKITALEEYFKKPFEDIDPAQYKHLKLVHTSKLPGTPTVTRELLFEDGEYEARIVPTEESNFI